MTYSRRQLYALGEPFGNSATRLKLGGRIYGGGGGNFISDALDSVSDVASDIGGGISDLTNAAGRVVNNGGRMFAIGDRSGDIFSDIFSGAGDVLSDVVSSVGDVVSDVGGAASGILSGASDAVKGFGDAISDAGAAIDDAVADVIPGGWTTIAEATAAAFGVPIEYITAAGAAKGSGILEGKPLNLENAVLGGVSAYGAANLGQGIDNYLQNSSTPMGPVQEVDLSDAGRTPDQIANNAPPANNPPPVETTPVETPKVTDVAETSATPKSPYSENATKSFLSEENTPLTENQKMVSDMTTTPQQPSTWENFKNAASEYLPESVTAGGVASTLAYGGLGLLALDALSNKNANDKASGATSNPQYEKNQAEIDKAIADAKTSVGKYPYSEEGGATDLTADRNRQRLGKTLYQQGRPVQVAGLKSLAVGGQVETPDTLMAGGITNSFHFDSGGSVGDKTATQLIAEAKNAIGSQGLGSMMQQQNPLTYASGGMANEPRFLSGGGDGMSDSIKASIDGHTEARLADGEFVVPADVVSHLGNGSSKAGAKQLYDMMDRIRKARTGNKKQGKQINPHRFLPS